MITNQQKVKYGLLCQIQKVMVFAWMCTLQSVNIENSKNFPNLKKFNNLISVEIKVCSCTRIYLKGCNQFPIRRVAPLLSKIWAENVSCWCPKKWFQNKTPSDWGLFQNLKQWADVANGEPSKPRHKKYFFVDWWFKCFSKLCFSWGLFMLFHANFSIMIHTVSIWLTLSLAVWRLVQIHQQVELINVSSSFYHRHKHHHRHHHQIPIVIVIK